MKNKLLHVIQTWPLFLFLLPCLFMLHRINEYQVPGLGKVAVFYIFLFTLIGLALSGLFFLITRDLRKAALVALFLLAFNFFFGPVMDLLKKLMGTDSFFVRYVFILPFFSALLVLLIIWLKRSRGKFRRLFDYLHLLLALLIVYELITYLPWTFKKNKYDPPPLSKTFENCDTCKRPDIYLIVLDEYASKNSLQEILGYDNSHFEEALKTRGFHIPLTSSNYNFTPYSMASAFNMDYIQFSRKENIIMKDILLSYNILNNNNVGSFFRSRGYTIYNRSFFDFQHHRKTARNLFFHPKSLILNFGTFYTRLRHEIGYNFANRKQKDRIRYNDFYNDEATDSLTRMLVTKKDEQPKFVYAHFFRPHHPYLVDSNGVFTKLPDSMPWNDQVKRGYTDLLIYSSKKLVSLVDHIQKNSVSPPIIIVASDHGFRQLYGTVDKKYDFMNFLAVYYPDQRYEGFYDGISLVNLFRVILNNRFGQHLPLLKDSTIFFNHTF